MGIKTLPSDLTLKPNVYNSRLPLLCSESLTDLVLTDFISIIFVVQNFIYVFKNHKLTYNEIATQTIIFTSTYIRRNVQI
jgi:hypothetical protein